MTIDKVSSQFIKNVKSLTAKKDWYYFVIEFKDDCKYHNNLKYNDVNKISRDISMNLKSRFNRIIRYYNNYFYSEDPYKFMNPPGKALYQSIDDIFEHGIVSRELSYNDLSFYGCIEFSPLLSQKKFLNILLPDNLNLGTHVHLFVRNRTGLSAEKLSREFQFKKGSNTWISEIEKISKPLLCNIDFYNTNDFIQYHIKQPFLERRIIYKV